MRNISSRSRSGEESGTPSELSRAKGAPTGLNRASLACQMASPTQVQLDILHPMVGCVRLMWGARIPIVIWTRMLIAMQAVVENIQSRGWQLA